jgi:hypothetical protein
MRNVKSCCTERHLNLRIMPLLLEYAIYGQLDFTNAPLTKFKTTAISCAYV